jgi:hypothetical protein
MEAEVVKGLDPRCWGSLDYCLYSTILLVQCMYALYVVQRKSKRSLGGITT